MYWSGEQLLEVMIADSKLTNVAPFTPRLVFHTIPNQNGEKFSVRVRKCRPGAFDASK